ncbi:MAG: hypothetical protein JOZ54_15820 [Acidobacteria bacterium]|nr:hypothetical protein [Acidobacteriota bacterium]
MAATRDDSHRANACDVNDQNQRAAAVSAAEDLIAICTVPSLVCPNSETVPEYFRRLPDFDIVSC